MRLMTDDMYGVPMIPGNGQNGSVSVSVRYLNMPRLLVN